MEARGKIAIIIEIWDHDLGPKEPALIAVRSIISVSGAARKSFRTGRADASPALGEPLLEFDGRGLRSPPVSFSPRRWEVRGCRHPGAKRPGAAIRGHSP